MIERRDLVKNSYILGLVPLAKYFWGSSIYAQSNFSLNKKLVWINMRGGWDILETTDPKVNSNDSVDVSYDYSLSHPLAGSNGVRIGRWLPNIAAHGSDVVVVRGLAMGTTSHDAGPVYMDTGVLSNAGTVNAASIPSIIASESEATIPIIQLNGGTNPQIDRGLLNPVSVVRAQNLRLYRSMYPETEKSMEVKSRILDYLQDSISRKKVIVGENDRLSAIEAAAAKIRVQFQNGVGSKLALTDNDRAPFNINRPTSLGRGREDAIALALKLIKNDLVSCINLGFGGFDTHSNQDRNLEPTLLNFDYLLGAFLTELKSANLLETTLIVVYSDFGRTPKINSRNGRDHWPVGGALLIGGGVQGGRSVGATDENLRALNINFDTGAADESGGQLSPPHLAGSVVELLLGSGYMEYRDYLKPISALTQLRA